MSWTEDRVGILKELWGQGKTAAQIAQILGGVTRNAVIGKANRLSLSGRASPIQQSKKLVAANTSVKTAPKKKLASVKKASGEGKYDLIDLNSRMCHFPSGDPKKAGFGFCGERVSSGLPYCEEHAAIAYHTPARAKKADGVEEMADKILASAKGA